MTPTETSELQPRRDGVIRSSAVVRCPHVERKERVIQTPCGMLMAVMECSACGDQQVGAHHYACERYQAPNAKVSDHADSGRGA